MFTILTGLILAGDLIDQQTGLSLGQIADPSLNITGSVTGQFLFQFAMTVLLVMQPTGYHVAMLSALVYAETTFHSLPLGEAFITASAVDLLCAIWFISHLVLGLQVAAPLIAAIDVARGSHDGLSGTLGAAD